MADNTAGLKRGWHYDKPNAVLEAWADGREVLEISSTTAQVFAAGSSELTLSATALYPTTSDGSALGTGTYMFSDLFLASGGVINFNNGDVALTHSADLLTMTGGGFTMGANAAPAGDFILYATQTVAKVWFDVNGDTNGTWYFGSDDYGFDVGFYGQTASNSMIWDASANALVFTAGKLQMGVASALILPVKASGTSTVGSIWLDTDDNYVHFYAKTGGYECTITGCIYS